jgi:hypothetical protein
MRNVLCMDVATMKQDSVNAIRVILVQPVLNCYAKMIAVVRYGAFVATMANVNAMVVLGATIVLGKFSENALMLHMDGFVVVVDTPLYFFFFFHNQKK